MKKDGLLNPQILSAIAAMGHTEYLVIADAGLPVPSGIPVIDISLIRCGTSFCHRRDGGRILYRCRRNGG